VYPSVVVKVTLFQRAEQGKYSRYRQTIPSDETAFFVDCASYLYAPCKKSINTFRTEWAKVLLKGETTGSAVL